MLNRRTSRVAIIGAGMSGILAGIKLRAAGFENIVIYEKAEKAGGTWRDNRYPGMRCTAMKNAARKLPKRQCGIQAVVLAGISIVMASPLAGLGPIHSLLMH